MKTALTRPREIPDGMATHFRIDYEYHGDDRKTLTMKPEALGTMWQFPAGTDAIERSPTAFIESPALTALREAYEAQRTAELAAHLNTDPVAVTAEVNALKVARNPIAEE